MTTIVDWEDGACLVNIEDKINSYKYWKALNENKLTYLDKTQNENLFFDNVEIKRQSLLLVRTAGIHLKTGQFYDWMIDTIAAILFSTKKLKFIVMPKLRGPLEVQFVCNFYSKLESLLKLPHKSIRIGIMDEERRTSLNLQDCISATNGRCFFINTGFLDRTGDEIRFYTYLGPIQPIKELKSAEWRKAYEIINVKTGKELNVPQIGKGMWGQTRFNERNV